MVPKVRAAFTTCNERIKPGDVIETSDKQHHKVSQILLINENLVILETNQYRERILNNSLARVNPVYGELCGSRSYIYFPSLFWRNVSPVDLYPENKETVYGKLNELLYDSIRRWELK